jgi:hypothetical protein
MKLLVWTPLGSAVVLAWWPLATTQGSLVAEWNPVVQCSTIATVEAPFEVCATSYHEAPASSSMDDQQQAAVLEGEIKHEYAIVSGLVEGTDTSCLPNATSFSTGIKVSVSRNQHDNTCQVTISWPNQDNHHECSSCRYCGDDRYTVDCSSATHGRSVTCESTAAGQVFFPLQASARDQQQQQPLQSPTNPPAAVAAPMEKVSDLPTGCSAWLHPPPLPDATRLFRGTVARELSPNVYVVHVKRAFQGCDIKEYDRVVVSFQDQSPQTTLLNMGTSYLFVGLPLDDEPVQLVTLEEKVLLGIRSKVKLAVRIGQANRFFEWQCIDPTDMDQLLAMQKVCPKTR